MDAQIRDILNNNRTDSTFQTHVTLHPKGKYQLNRSSLEKFWHNYCTYVENHIFPADKNNSKQTEKVIKPPFGIAESPQSCLPVLVDVDLKVKDNDIELINDRLYTDEQLKAVVSVYQNTIRTIVDNIEREDLICVVLEKKLYTETKNDITYLKNGFHLHFPYCILSKNDIEVHLIPRVKEILKEMKLFINLGKEDSGDVIDKASCKNNWLLYGSTKEENREPYKVTRIYDADVNEITLKKAFKNYLIYDEKEKIIPLNKENIHFYLPRILSIFPYGRTTKEIKHGIVSPLKEKIRKERKSSVVDDVLSNPEENIKKAKILLNMLSDHRADDRNDWLSIGWILYNISDGSSEALELWCEFSSRCPDKYDESVCINFWDKMTKGTLHMGTLCHYAKIDNPTEYANLKKESGNKHVAAALDGSHNDIAKALFEEYGDEFRCGSVTNKIWYQFKNHKWEQIEEGIFLRKKISGKLAERYIEVGKKLYEEMSGEDMNDKTKAVGVQQRHKQVMKMIANLKNANYKNSVMKECIEVFYDPRFIQKLDVNPALIAFNNGVYDLEFNTFRPGRPEDFLSKCMPINYVNYSEDDDKVVKVHEFLEQVFPDKTLRKYFLDVSSDVFLGGNHEKIVVFWIGEGDNGKSITQKFFELMLGQLCIKLDTNVITGKKPASGSAFPELARAGGGVRWVVLEEPNGDESINNGILKHLSGNDKYYARDLFEKGKDGREIQPLFKLVIIANKAPKIKNADKAVWNRVRVIPFEATFCRDSDPAPSTYEEQLREKRFPMDKQFGKKIPGLVEAFAWVLLQHRQHIGARIEPEKVKLATEYYKKQNDIYRQFMEECVLDDENDIISLTELYVMFKNWFKESLPGNSLPVKNDIEEYFTKLWGNPQSGKKWIGHRERRDRDDIKSGNAIVVTEEDRLPEDSCDIGGRRC